MEIVSPSTPRTSCLREPTATRCQHSLLDHIPPSDLRQALSQQDAGEANATFPELTWKITPDHERDLLEPQFLLGNLQRVRLSFQLHKYGGVHTSDDDSNHPKYIGNRRRTEQTRANVEIVGSAR
jgi:hypothetical protein